jgi:hypothetical protein
MHRRVLPLAVGDLGLGNSIGESECVGSVRGNPGILENFPCKSARGVGVTELHLAGKLVREEVL